MTAQPIERSAMTRRFPTNHDGQSDVLSLRSELFLIAHNETTGHPHVEKRSLTLGLAAAVLLELWFADRIRIGWRPDARNGIWQQHPGHITVLDATPTGDPITDTALTLLWNLGGTPRINDFVRAFTTTNLYERVRGHMIAAGTLCQTPRRRFRFFHTDAYLPTHTAYPIRIRARIRNLATQRHTDHEQIDHHGLALAALVTMLRLGAYLYPPDMSPAQLQQRLNEITKDRSHTAIGEVTAAIRPRRTAKRNR
ncbi:MAG TPA: GPP34 family phosphoprotein [Micromonosporaceae bacterium]